MEGALRNLTFVALNLASVCCVKPFIPHASFMNGLREARKQTRSREHRQAQSSAAGHAVAALSLCIVVLAVPCDGQHLDAVPRTARSKLMDFTFQWDKTQYSLLRSDR